MPIPPRIFVPVDGVTIGFNGALYVKDYGISSTKLNFSTWERIADVTITDTRTEWDFTGLDINRDGAYIIYANVKNDFAGGTRYYIYVEGDYTSANYRCHWIGGTGTATTVTGGELGFPEIGYAVSGGSACMVVYLQRDPFGYFRYTSLSSEGPGTMSKTILRQGQRIYTLDNITSIRFSGVNLGGLGIGSRIILCRPRTI